jgi:hypothetical protein
LGDSEARAGATPLMASPAYPAGPETIVPDQSVKWGECPGGQAWRPGLDDLDQTNFNTKECREIGFHRIRHLSESRFVRRLR